MTVDRPRTLPISRFSTRLRAAALAVGVGAALASALSAGTAHAAPVAPTETTPSFSVLEIPQAGPPMSVPAGSFEYTATHSVTKQLSTMSIPEAILALPVPADYRPANAALAARLDVAMMAALADPRGCLQIIVDPQPDSGNLFDYGVYPISGEYCP
ncbi:hypothetical protein ABLE92_04095 [Gordonia sp. VNQ95]|uniref:hypothetical protein n=1 Tax=Gordonia TaxID=2053 RepID=UPI0032B3F952